MSNSKKTTKPAQSQKPNQRSDFEIDDEVEIDSPENQDSDDSDPDFMQDDLNVIFDEDEIFNEKNVASLESLGISDPDGDDPNVTNFFHAGLPLNLQAPPARPGYTQKFVSYLDRSGKRNDVNISKSQRKGWLPRKIKPGEFPLPTKKIGNSAIIMIDGLVLCEMPIERRDAITRAQQGQTQRNNAAVESNFREEGRSGMVPIAYKEQNETKRGTRRPQVAPNRNS